MAELVEFLLARLAEDEAVARLVAADLEPVKGELIYTVQERVDDATTLHRRVRIYNAARVLADVAALRRLLELLGGDAMGAEGAYEWAVLQHLALRYADHPDYRQEWAP